MDVSSLSVSGTAMNHAKINSNFYIETGEMRSADYDPQSWGFDKALMCESLRTLPPLLCWYPKRGTTKTWTSFCDSFRIKTFLYYSALLDGNFLAIGSHDNYIYIYAVAENGRKYSRVGKCSVSAFFHSSLLRMDFIQKFTTSESVSVH